MVSLMMSSWSKLVCDALKLFTLIDILKFLQYTIHKEKLTTTFFFSYQDENDNPPIFAKAVYTASVMENASESTTVIQVHATDRDGTDLNNQFLYRIDSGAQDKFRINFQTGIIIVEKGAKLDRETLADYTLIVSATDRGINALMQDCHVKISILDVNDELPTFKPTMKSISILESASVGYLVTSYPAHDLDLNPNLRYSIVTGSVRAVNENSQSVDIQAHGIQVGRLKHITPKTYKLMHGKYRYM